jgi:hypothetical protein
MWEIRSMSVWMLLVFAVWMISAVLSFAPGGVGPLALPVFALTGAVFLTGLARRGIRRPVV